MNYYFNSVNSHTTVFKISISYVKKIDFRLLNQAEMNGVSAAVLMACL